MSLPRAYQWIGGNTYRNHIEMFDNQEQSIFGAIYQRVVGEKEDF